MNKNKISGSWSSLYIFSSFIPHSTSIILICILLFPYTLLLSLLLSICFPLRFSAAGNGTYRLRPDGDDSQAVPAQDHHCWHQRLRPPHWLCPHQEGGQELSFYSLLLYLLLSDSFRSPGPLLLVVFPLSFCVMNVRKIWISSKLSRRNVTCSHSLVIHRTSPSNDRLKKKKKKSFHFQTAHLIYRVLHTQQLFLPLLPTHPNWTWIFPPHSINL